MTFFVLRDDDVYWGKDMKKEKPLIFDSMDALRKKAPSLMSDKKFQRRYGYLIIWEGEVFDPTKPYKYTITYTSGMNSNPYELDCRGRSSTGGFGKIVWRMELRPMYRTPTSTKWREVI